MIYIISGHYGSGKTEIALNLARSLDKPAIIDLDIVNPYFRTADAAGLLSELGIKLIAPSYANTNIDIPALPAEIYSALSGEGNTVIDVGGDDAGAVALGQFNRYFTGHDYTMYYVINARRPMTESAEDTVRNLRDIENASRLKVTGLINNTNIKNETTTQVITSGQKLVDEVSEITGIPAVAVAGKKDLLSDIQTHLAKLSLILHLNFPWEEGVLQ